MDGTGSRLAAPPGGTAAATLLLLELSRLDRRLAPAVAAMQAAHGPDAAADPYRGLYVSDLEAGRLVARPTPAQSCNHGEGLMNCKHYACVGDRAIRLPGDDTSAYATGVFTLTRVP